MRAPVSRSRPLFLVLPGFANSPAEVTAPQVRQAVAELAELLRRRCGSRRAPAELLADLVDCLALGPEPLDQLAAGGGSDRGRTARRVAFLANGDREPRGRLPAALGAVAGFWAQPERNWVLAPGAPLRRRRRRG